jgi:histidine phosphotransferase ChpT
MDEEATIGDLELAALISSRICHDVISPVGAISNGLEMLDEEQDESMREQTMDLIRKSARQASAKLQFARLAFGAAGSAGAEIDLRDAERVARDFVQGGKHTLSWQGPPVTLPKNKVKLLLNLLALGVVALPRGGTVMSRSRGRGLKSPSGCSRKGSPHACQSKSPACLPARTAWCSTPIRSNPITRAVWPRQPA